MKKLLFLASLVLFGAIGCQPIEGTLEIAKAITFLVTEETGNPDDCMDWEWCEPNTVITEESFAPGRYSAEINLDSRKLMTLKFKKGKDLKTIKFAIPEGREIPEHDGDFSFSADEIKQKYNLAGNVHTELSRSETVRDHESCTYTTREWVCHRRPNPPRYPLTLARDCYWEDVIHYGYQDVEYHYEYETKNVSFSLKLATETDATAHFAGSKTDTDKVYEYIGRCY